MVEQGGESPDAAQAAPPGHRERLIAAMAESIKEKGYRDTTVADVVRIARTSRRNFYEHFDDRDGCFLALFDATNAVMMGQIAAAVDPEASLDAQVDAAVDAYIDNVCEQPALYASFVRELPGLGQAGADRGLVMLERFAALLVTLVDSARAAQPELAGAAADDGHRDHHRRRSARAGRDLAATGARRTRAAGERGGDRQGDPRRHAFVEPQPAGSGPAAWRHR